MSIAGLKYYLSSQANMFDFFASRNMLNWMSDEAFLKRKFKLRMGYELDLDNPKTFNEKLQWLKLYDRNPLYTKLVDKYEVRKYIAEKIGEEYLIPLVGGPWNSPEEIDFDALPDQFVLKCTHDSGGVIICKDKSALDIPAAKAKLAKRLKRNFYWMNREWPYKDVPPRIIAEKYMEDETGELRDFKFLCFNGIAKMIELHSGRFEKHTQDFYDAQWKRLDIIQGAPMADEQTPRPKFLDDMLEMSNEISKKFPHLRVDWYGIEGKLYLGELTLYDGSGMCAFTPEEWDSKLGSWIELPHTHTHTGWLLMYDGGALWIHQEFKAEQTELKDYKFFCFNGTPRMMYISRDAAADTTDFFDMDFNHLPIRMKDPNSAILPPKPECFEEMQRIASVLSEGIPLVRTDFYCANSKIYFGELTFFHNGGFTGIKPAEWNYKVGSWIKLPGKE